MAKGRTFRPARDAAMDRHGRLEQASGRRGTSRRTRLLAGVATVAGHVLVLLPLVLARPAAPPLAEPPPMVIELVAAPGPALALEAAAPAAPAAAGRAAPMTPVALEVPPRPVPAEVEPLRIAEARSETPDEGLSEGAGEDLARGLSAGELAGARTAGVGAGMGGGGAGAGGRGCDMVQWLEAALRKDPKMRAAVARAQGATGPGGAAVLVWNGDWLRSREEAGRGLAGVREAMIMQIAFAPEACRAEPVRGLVLIALDEAPGAPRLALGTGYWNWSDLLFAKGAAPPRGGGR